MNPRTQGWMCAPAAVLFVALCLASSAFGQTAPPGDGTSLAPQRWDERGSAFKHAFKPLVRHVQRLRQESVARYQTTAPPEKYLTELGMPLQPIQVDGTRRILVLPLLFQNSGPPPYPQQALQQQLFGLWPTGTLTDYYREVSYGALTLTGDVGEWKTVSREDAWYEGSSIAEGDVSVTCNGRCVRDRVPELIKEVLALHSEVDWRQYDNDGPDGLPDSGDDDGFVDFVVIQHPETGGECNGSNLNLWSHHFNLSSYEGGAPYDTSVPRRGGDGNILVDDYVILPSLACDGRTMIQIGVFAHELGHAFTLPDLYDTDGATNGWAGLGTWCLMAAGNWGADWESPQRPVHLSPWAKAYMGWLDLQWVSVAEQSILLPDVERHRVAYAVAAPGDKAGYYIVVNSQQQGFDRDLPISGLQVWHVKPPALEAGWKLNQVNVRPGSKGVDLVEADGSEWLDERGSTARRGDLFPGSAGARQFDATTRPAAMGRLGICDISDPGAVMRVRIVRGADCSSGGQVSSRTSRLPHP
ncbi:M6 family metalloprotease domain-containing protein [Corallococcus silvisoli]|uniref:M6 family metalloprotease domain-containing protein n=1 Tax=Corallococcus silvisoli TaxID=2697031 RepID=UPI0013777BAF|nr:M6 family metalloprotease domain-containing protein [Corallococcus silvisoli]NBD13858.1 M6 family metalloprotease domain-containing protein [Corallococcus silvisoli]